MLYLWWMCYSRRENQQSIYQTGFNPQVHLHHSRYCSTTTAQPAAAQFASIWNQDRHWLIPLVSVFHTHCNGIEQLQNRLCVNVDSHLRAERGNNLLLAPTTTELVHPLCQLNSEEICEHLASPAPVLLCHTGQAQWVPSPHLAVFIQPWNRTAEG